MGYEGEGRMKIDHDAFSRGVATVVTFQPLRQKFARILIGVGLKLWRTDLSFWQYPFGPPNRGIRNGLAWLAYHAGIAIRDAARKL